MGSFSVPRTAALALLVCAAGMPPSAAIECFTPREWQPRLTGTPLDENRNFIADSLDVLAPGTGADVVLDLNRCPDGEDLARLALFGEIVLVGESVSVVALHDVPQEALEALSRDEIVAFVEEDALLFSCLEVCRPTVRADLVTATYGYDGAGQTIAIVDTGVDDGLHVSLPATSFVGGIDCALPGGCACINPDDDDFNGHGTHVASTALGRGGGDCPGCVGMAPAAGLVDVKVFKPGFPLQISTFVKADQMILSKKCGDWGIDVVNMSFANCLSGNGSEILSVLANQLVHHGMVTTASMGSTNACNPPYPQNFNLVPMPANADDVIAVGSSADQNTVNRADDIVVSTSFTGPRLPDGDLDTQDELKPDLAAPGFGILAAKWNTQTQYHLGCGTSSAAAVVAGCAALLHQANPAMLPLSLKQLLLQKAEDKGSPGWDGFWGNGLLDCFETVQELVESTGTDLRFEIYDCKPGSPPCWTTPELYTAAPPIEGKPNSVTAEVTNAGPNPVSGFSVSLGVYDFGNGQATDHICTQQVNTVVPVGGKVAVTCPYTPHTGVGPNTPATVEANLRAEIIYPFDTDFANNRAVHKVGILTKLSVFPFDWTLTQWSPVFQDLHVSWEEVCCGGGLGDAPECACAGWRLQMSDIDVPMAPDDCPKIVTTVAEAVDVDAVRSARYDLHVTGTDQAGNTKDFGGLTVEARLDCRVTDLQWDNAETFRWLSSPFTACPDAFDVVRGRLPLGPGGFSDAECLEDDDADMVATDPEVPRAGGFYYLVRAGGPDPGTWNEEGAAADRDAALGGCP